MHAYLLCFGTKVGLKDNSIFYVSLMPIPLDLSQNNFFLSCKIMRGWKSAGLFLSVEY